MKPYCIVHATLYMGCTVLKDDNGHMAQYIGTTWNLIQVQLWSASISVVNFVYVYQPVYAILYYLPNDSSKWHHCKACHLQ